MTDKLDPAVLADPAEPVAEPPAEVKDPVLVSAESYRAKIEADPAVTAAAQAAQLNQLVANRLYYQKLADECAAAIKQLTAGLDSKDADVAAIAASVAGV